ncbi:hypothetical protein EW145_g1330 [Phellinidium pouzarii]|uniref:Phosphoglycerate mutase family protein n=1 Tax=Phellinidium pouzarii TaxID=167371 RepID=A0A4S4LGR0_9AGAM|nr:hypothetical protein EW145_g1330 [Phellinidium pouzarii]
MKTSFAALSLVGSLISLAMSPVRAAKAPSIANTVYLIRHGEKPTDGSDGLSAQGEERAQCLVNVFGTSSDFNIGYIIAEKPKSSGARERPLQTVTPLAQSLGLTVDTSCSKKDSSCVADAVADFAKTSNSNILICWEHGELTDIAEALGVNDAPEYPDDAFNIIWTLQDQTIPSRGKHLLASSLASQDLTYVSSALSVQPQPHLKLIMDFIRRKFKSIMYRNKVVPFVFRKAKRADRKTKRAGPTFRNAKPAFRKAKHAGSTFREAKHADLTFREAKLADSTFREAKPAGHTYKDDDIKIDKGLTVCKHCWEPLVIPPPTKPQHRSTPSKRRVVQCGRISESGIPCDFMFGVTPWQEEQIELYQGAVSKAQVAQNIALTVSH